MLFSPPMTGSRRPRLLLVEDHPLVQDAVGKILWARCDVVGIIGRGHDVLAAVQSLRPDAVILDISLPEMGGMQVLPELRSAFPSVAIVIFTVRVEPIYQQEALARGANEFVSKFQANKELLPAIERALTAVRYSDLPCAPRAENWPHNL